MSQQTKKFETVNPEIDQNRVFDTVAHFERFGCVMFPEQVTIYENIGRNLASSFVIEAGCGNGLGTALLSQWSHIEYILGTDKLLANINFARCLYPWLNFKVWNINNDFESVGDSIEVEVSIVCVETIEHVADPLQAIKNLINAAQKDVWISTPNGLGKKKPPENPFHVCEYTPKEMLSIIREAQDDSQTLSQPDILHWKTMEKLSVETTVDPLIYRIKL